MKNNEKRRGPLYVCILLLYLDRMVKAKCHRTQMTKRIILIGEDDEKKEGRMRWSDRARGGVEGVFCERRRTTNKTKPRVGRKGRKRKG